MSMPFNGHWKGVFPRIQSSATTCSNRATPAPALVSDVELYEEYPSRYDVDADRRRRWIRGDWQITPWLWSRVPGPGLGRIANPLSVLSQWKILDNLRRSLVPGALVALLLGSWFLLPEAGGPRSLTAFWIIALPGVLAALVNVARKPDDWPWVMHLRLTAGSCARQLGQILLTLVFLPYDAFISLDAAARTMTRLLLTHKHLLEWQTSSEAERRRRAGLLKFYAAMWIAPILAAAACSLLLTARPGELPWALPILGAWFAAPWLAWRISRPIESAPPDLAPAQVFFLRAVARKTWHFFETFVTAQENWLPPDNFQEVPAPVVAARTSPTNMGLALLANLAARDFGYLPGGGLLQRTHDALATMQQLKRYRGHFFNWYETRTMRPLLPFYVSAVDSGNLAGHLLTLAAGLREQPHERIFTPQIFAGLRDTVKALGDLAGHNPPLETLDAILQKPPSGLRAAFGLLEAASAQAAKIAAALAGEKEEIKDWAQTLQRNCEEHLAELRFLAPWLALPIPSAEAKLRQLEAAPTLHELAAFELSLRPRLESSPPELARCVREAAGRARQRLAALEKLAAQCDDLAAMDFTFLFDTTRDLFATGFNVTDHRCDASFYDLLASEARLCSYVAIALGQAPQEHWFSMGRLLVGSHGKPILVSWSGSMFEYLMPLLVMPNYENTLLDHTCQAAVQQQIAYGKLREVPWGISESGYNRTDAAFNYQYRAFGVPGLGLKRGLAEDLVIAPYATALALMVEPVAACENLQRLAHDGFAGAYGFYEAVDYTASRLPPDATNVIIRSFMSHHQGMSLLALDSLLQRAPMQRRFLACPQLKAAELLLHERVPKTAASVLSEELALEESRNPVEPSESVMRVFPNPGLPSPEIHLLSNGRYHVVVSSAGGGYSRWRDLAVTRWREDATQDCWGTFIYLRDLATGDFWSTAFQPTARPTRGYEAIFTQARAEFRQRHAGLDIHTEISVSPEDDVELRRVTIINRSSVARVIELTSYAETVLATPAEDAAHPAFSNLFVQTEFAEKSSALLCTRRARSAEERPPWLLHLLVGQGGGHGPISCETDRARFVGRGGSLAHPAVMRTVAPLSNTVGSVLDPIISLRRAVTLPPHGTAVIDLVVGMAENRETALALVEKYQSARMADRALDLAWTHSEVTLRQLNLTEVEAQLYGRLAGALVYANPTRRAHPAVLRNNRRGQSGLWSYGISGDAPIVLLRISDTGKIELARQLIQAHSYWRMKGLTVDLVILNEDVSVYRQSLQDQITSVISSGIEAQMLDKPGGIFVRRLEQIPNDDRVLLQAAARIVLDDEKGTLAEQMESKSMLEPVVPPLRVTREVTLAPPAPLPPRELLFPNGLGGFTRDGHEYVITLRPGESTPAPWVNVLANPFFGTVISESGAAYTWVENAHEFRLTPWSNDPVQDPTGRGLLHPRRADRPILVSHPHARPRRRALCHPPRFWLHRLRAHREWHRLRILGLRRDGRPGEIQCPQAAQRLGPPAPLVRHRLLRMGPGRPPAEEPAARPNRSGPQDRRVARPQLLQHRIPRSHRLPRCQRHRALRHRRPQGIHRPQRQSRPARRPGARAPLRQAGAGLDPCAAVQVSFTLGDGEERETCFRLGVGRNPADIQNLIQRYRRADASRVALENVWAYWNRALGAINVDTPDPSVNIMANGWLLYQTSVAGSGAAPAFINPAAPSVSATSCRTSWRSSTPNPP